MWTTRYVKCPNCDYDLRGSEQRRCPECGGMFTRAEAAAADRAAAEAWSGRIWWWAISRPYHFWRHAGFRMNDAETTRFIMQCGAVACLMWAAGTGALLARPMRWGWSQAVSTACLQFVIGAIAVLGGLAFLAWLGQIRMGGTNRPSYSPKIVAAAAAWLPFWGLRLAPGTADVVLDVWFRGVSSPTVPEETLQTATWLLAPIFTAYVLLATAAVISRRMERGGSQDQQTA